LGSGTVSDGSGPGTYTDLVSVFQSYSDVWLEVQVGAETLTPRTKFQSSPSALNASSLGGRSPAYYLDTSSSAQTKSGQLHIFNGDSDPNTYAIIAEDPNGRGIRAIGGIGGIAVVAQDPNGRGVFASGQLVGGEFENPFGGTSAFLAGPYYAVQASSPGSAGTFWGHNAGVEAFADDPNGSALWAGSNGLALHARGGTTAVWASGDVAGGYFAHYGSGGSAALASGGLGISPGGAAPAG